MKTTIPEVLTVSALSSSEIFEVLDTAFREGKPRLALCIIPTWPKASFLASLGGSRRTH
jgi:hypothetical protein